MILRAMRRWVGNSTLVLAAWASLLAIPLAAILSHLENPGQTWLVVVAVPASIYLSAPPLDRLEQRIGVISWQNSFLRRKAFRMRIRQSKVLKYILIPPVSSLIAGISLSIVLSIATIDMLRDQGEWLLVTGWVFLSYAWAVILALTLHGILSKD